MQPVQTSIFKSALCGGVPMRRSSVVIWEIAVSILLVITSTNLLDYLILNFQLQESM